MINLTLVVIPGPGARSVSLQDDRSVQDLVDQESLTGRDIIVNGQGVERANWGTFYLSQGDEVFATASVKGNAKNGPSQTGRPSGGGRGNNPPRTK